MATQIMVARVPFAPIDSPRLQQLESAKNRQNGMIAQNPVLSGKANVNSPRSLLSPSKRRFEPSSFDDVDSENVDPAIFDLPFKKSKSDPTEKLVKPFTFSVTPKSMPPPSTVPSRLSTPIGAPKSSPRVPLTAPAGRSPKRPSAGVNKTRRVSAPFSRIDPPFSSQTSSTLPFSLDAALNGILSNPLATSAGATIQESMPKNWVFDIYEDTPEENAANLMEHSTLTLDLSSDDESTKKQRHERGKENMPPEDYDAPTASRTATEGIVAAPKLIRKIEIIRKKVLTDDMDDGQRSPLSDLETDPFIPEGLDKDSYIFIQPTPEKAGSFKLDAKDLFVTTVPFSTKSMEKPNKNQRSIGLFDLPVVDGKDAVRGDILVWEDSPASERPGGPVLSRKEIGKDE